eukprot:3747010-Amphidinium_carterae.2
MDVRKELIQDAPVPFTSIRVRFIIPVHVKDVQRATTHLQVDDHMHPERTANPPCGLPLGGLCAGTKKL